mgnify:CR=1 FL=1
MKKLFYTALILPLILVSCESRPRAYFSANPGDPVVGEEVWFTNESENASDLNGISATDISQMSLILSINSIHQELLPWF